MAHMARLPVTSDRIQRLVTDHLAPGVIALGSVRELSRRLNEALKSIGHAGLIHPNRLRAILSDDSNLSVNDSTVSMLEAAVPHAALGNGLDAAFQRLSERVSERWWATHRRVEDIARIAASLNVPPAAVRVVLAATPHGAVATNEVLPVVRLASGVAEPDWSFQEEAVARCFRALNSSLSAKVGAVLPTGAGKTRVGLRIALRMLESAPDESRVCWITHRRHLRRQAHRELQRMLKANAAGLPADAAKKLSERVEFRMVGELPELLEQTTPLACVIVDEAHHAAAASYAPIFATPYPQRALLLTATPNRTDGLPLGIEHIAYSITYRELADRGVILMPEFLDFPVDDFEWDAEDVKTLAEDIVSRARNQFTKTLVLAPRIARVEEFYTALLDAWLEHDGHPLDSNDIGYIHSARNSLGIEADDFLSVFADKPRAILVSAQMLLEGFDDPTIDSVVMTYPSGSLITMMQAAGRCVRYSPGKQAAFVMQATNPDLAYRFDQRWLYQDISDYLRPELIDVFVTTLKARDQRVAQLLDAHRVTDAQKAEATARLGDPQATGTIRILLYGLPHFGPTDRFDELAHWGAVVVTPANEAVFRTLFNDFCAAGADIPDTSEFLRQRGPRLGLTQGTLAWRQYAEMLTSMYLAQREVVTGATVDPINEHRPFVPHRATTWLKYVTVHVEAAVDPLLDLFLADCFNRDLVLALLAADPTLYERLVKVPLPLAGFEAFALDNSASHDLDRLVTHIRTRLTACPPEDQIAQYSALIVSLDTVALPIRLCQRIEHVLLPELWTSRTLSLVASAPHRPSAPTRFTVTED